MTTAPTDTLHPEARSLATLAEVLSRLYARIPLGMRLGLEPMRAACARLGHPERATPAVHVAGTNGKGSVCAMVESIARAEGLRTGLYTSPHLCRFAERIRIGGEPMRDEALVDLLSGVLDAAPELSFFETATLAAFVAFRAAAVDVAIIEVGIGGRLDATNVLATPRAAAITRVALDHVERLGPTLEAIAREKAGIAKPGLNLVLGSMPVALRAVIDEVAASHGATTSTVDGLPLPGPVGLAGEHQADNARVASSLAERLGVTRGAIATGLAQTCWPGRLERIGSHLLDAAHNPDGARSLARYVESLSVPPERTALVFGALGDKDWRGMLDALGPLAAQRVYVGPSAAARAAVDPLELRAYAPGTVADTAKDALAAAQGTLVIVAGSLVLVGEARAQLLDLERDPPVAL